jgi:phosphomannomutase/phosphoglucomutase
MKLIFGVLSMIVAGIVLLAGAGVFSLSMSELGNYKQQTVTTLATGIAYSVSAQMQIQEHLVAQIAANEEVVNALASADPLLIEKKALQMQSFFPNVMKIRLLPASVESIDESTIPIMGYADLEMVKRTLLAPQAAIIQGEGASRHLAMTAAIKQDGQTIGVVLASLRFDFLADILANANIGDNFVELNQAGVVLMTAGNTALKSKRSLQMSLAHSPWQLTYSAASVYKFSSISLMTAIVLGLGVFASILLFAAYFYTTALLKKDENKVLEAVKDLMTGKELGHYPMQISEMQAIISTLAQFKRILDNKQARSHLSEDDDDSLKLGESDLLADADIFNPTKISGKSTAMSMLKKKN